MSDLDLAVLLERGLSREGNLHLDLLADLEEACRRDDLDLVILNRAGPIIRDRVVRHGRLIFAASDVERVRFEAAAIKEALDFHHFSRVYDEALFRQLAEGR
jgi:predicted nucleotidyltransferase